MKPPLLENKCTPVAWRKICLPKQIPPGKARAAFSLIEVVIALGIFVFAIIAIIGLLGVVSNSVRDVARSDEAASVVESVNAFLMGSTKIAPTANGRFEKIYEELEDKKVLTLFAFRRFTGVLATEKFEVGFFTGDGFPDEATISDFSDVAGPVFRVLLSASSVTPEGHREDGDGTALPGYTLTKELNDYPEGYLAMEVRIFVDENAAANPATDLVKFANERATFTYTMAVVR